MLTGYSSEGKFQRRGSESYAALLVRTRLGLGSEKQYQTKRRPTCSANFILQQLHPSTTHVRHQKTEILQKPGARGVSNEMWKQLARTGSKGAPRPHQNNLARGANAICLAYSVHHHIDPRREKKLQESHRSRRSQVYE